MENSEHDVQLLNTDMQTSSNLRWDDLRAFAVLARHGSLRAAATAQHVSVNTVRARLDRLEQDAGAVLVRRSRVGIQLTDAGVLFLDRVRAMRDVEPAGDAPGDTDVLVKPGELRIACSEALGAFWLTPKLNELSRSVPDLCVNLQLSYDLAQDRSGDHDIGLTYHLPADPDLIVSRLATMHMILFASPDYIAREGVPETLDDMREHCYVEQVTNGANSTIIDYIFGKHRPKKFASLRSNSAITQFWAVTKGAGIGVFPTYTHVMTDFLVPIDLPFQLRFELYYYYHPDAKRSPAIQAALSWLREAFSAERYPWFSDQFVHPRDFPRTEETSEFSRGFFGDVAR